MYEELKRRRILVRYMVYPGWGDGLRITVGTDEEIEACLETCGRWKSRSLLRERVRS